MRRFFSATASALLICGTCLLVTPTQLTAATCTADSGATCECDGGCSAGAIYCWCEPPRE